MVFEVWVVLDGMSNRSWLKENIFSGYMKHDYMSAGRMLYEIAKLISWLMCITYYVFIELNSDNWLLKWVLRWLLVCPSTCGVMLYRMYKVF